MNDLNIKILEFTNDIIKLLNDVEKFTIEDKDYIFYMIRKKTENLKNILLEKEKTND